MMQSNKVVELDYRSLFPQRLNCSSFARCSCFHRTESSPSQNSNESSHSRVLSTYEYMGENSQQSTGSPNKSEKSSRQSRRSGTLASYNYMMFQNESKMSPGMQFDVTKLCYDLRIPALLSGYSASTYVKDENDKLRILLGCFTTPAKVRTCESL